MLPIIRLEYIRPHASIRGIIPDATVTAVSVQWFGSEALELTYKDPAGRVGNVLLYRSDEPRLELVEAGWPWSFEGEGTLFRLVSEAYRIRLAYLFDPVLAARRFYIASGQRGLYTRRKGLDREQNKDLLLKHLQDAFPEGCAMNELQQVVPALSRAFVKRPLDELRREGKVRLDSRKRWSRWFAVEPSRRRNRRLGVRLVAMVGEGLHERVYLAATFEQEAIATQVRPAWELEGELAEDPRNIWCVGYGLLRVTSLFTRRQLTAMVTLAELVREVRADVRRDAERAGLPPAEAEAYAATVSTFLALALDRCADFNNSLCGWNPSNQKVMHLFGRQAIPMVWDFAVANVWGDSVGGWTICPPLVRLAVSGQPATPDPADNWTVEKDLFRRLRASCIPPRPLPAPG